MVHLYKHKGNCHLCDNHRGISLLCTAGKILGRVLTNRLTHHIADTILPESQCGFRASRGTSDMMFSLRQVQEKCREQNQDLYMVFVDLTKAFDSVGRKGLWSLLAKVGCPEKAINIIRSFHDGMVGCVLNESSISDPFAVNNGT